MITGRFFGVTGNDEWVPGVHRGGGGQPTSGKPIGLGGGAPALGGLVGQPKKALVPDEITDVTRVSGMVRKRRLLYRMTSFDYRKVFRSYRE